MRRTLIVSAVASVSSVVLVASTMAFLQHIDHRHAAATMDLNAAVRKVSLIRGFLPELLDPAAYGTSPRWQRQLAELTPILNAIPTFDEGSEALKTRILEENHAIEALFANLARAGPRPDRGNREIIAGQLDVRTASIVSDILAMNDLTAEHIIRQKRLVLAIMAASIVVLAGVIVSLLIVLQRRVVSPVLRLQRAVARFSKGELDEPIPVSGTNEVSALAAGFDYMRKSLSERMAELDAARTIIEKENETLAQRVEERTAQLRAVNRELEQASRAKDLFLATMSHEIRTPMNGVVGMVEVLSHTGLSERQADLIKTIRDSASTLLAIIDDILDYSKIEAGRLDIEHKPVSVSELIEGLCNSLVPVAAQRGVDLSLYVSPEIPERVLSDDVRLRQVIYNLVGNAIKFSGGRNERRGHVRVRADIVHEDAPLLLSIRVQDNGIGMSPETLKVLFRPFTQAEVSTTRLFGGTGLGLAICRRLVTMMHGEIDVESRPGEGSTFSVVLPFDLPEEQPAAALPDIAGVRCIVVRDEWLEFEAVQSYLSHANAEVHVAAETPEAASLARSISAPIVIQGAARDGFSLDRLHREFGAAAEVRHLVVMRGQHPHIRIEAPDLVIVDGEALRRKVLIRAVAVAAGRASPDAAQQMGAEAVIETAASPSVEEARAAGTLILVAEDDDINQKVILQQLGLLGHAAEMAANGAEALERWRAGRYGLLLTDLHMPEMDGYSLTHSIRQIEEQEHRKHLPIIALTANALRGEEIRIKAAGMDDYLTKPASLKLLKQTLDKWMPLDGSKEAKFAAPQNRAANEAEPDFDPVALHDVIGDDEAAAREFLVTYIAGSEAAIAELRSAAAVGDFAHLGAAAHRLKSSSRSIGVLRVGKLCGELEETAKAHSRTGAGACLASLEKAITSARESISGYLQDGAMAIVGGSDHENTSPG